jgi:hypothetical protein
MWKKSKLILGYGNMVDNIMKKVGNHIIDAGNCDNKLEEIQ